MWGWGALGFVWWVGCFSLVFFPPQAFLCYQHMPSSGTCLSSYNFFIPPSVNLLSISILPLNISSEVSEAAAVKKIILYVGGPDSQDYGTINSLFISATSSKVRNNTILFLTLFGRPVSALKSLASMVQTVSLWKMLNLKQQTEGIKTLIPLFLCSYALVVSNLKKGKPGCFFDAFVSIKRQRCRAASLEPFPSLAPRATSQGTGCGASSHLGKCLWDKGKDPVGCLCHSHPWGAALLAKAL